MYVCTYHMYNVFTHWQVPHYRREQIVFEVHPPSLSLTVTNDSITVQVHTCIYRTSDMVI